MDSPRIRAVSADSIAVVGPKNGIKSVHIALVVVQLGYAGLQMFSRVALDAGLNQFLLSMYRNIIAFVLLAPFAYYFERYLRSETPGLSRLSIY
jgi:hypothetical protein